MQESIVRMLELSTYRTSTMLDLPTSCQVLGVSALKKSLSLLFVDTNNPGCKSITATRLFHVVEAYEVIDHKHPLTFIGQARTDEGLFLVFEEKESA